MLVANATCGLMVALAALLQQADPLGAAEFVVVPSFTFPAAAHAIRWCGREPLFLDVESTGWHLDPAALEDALRSSKSRIAAVVACSSFGVPPAREVSSSWSAICRDVDVPLLVDSAAGFGSRLEDGSRLGRQGNAEVFSFHATKPFAVGEGGLIATSDQALAARMRSLTNFGMDARREVTLPMGLNAKLSEQHAATGLAVLEGYDATLTERRHRAQALLDVAGAAGYAHQAAADRGTWQFVPLLAPEGMSNTELIASAGLAGIECRAYYQPLHQSEVFDAAPRRALSWTEELSRRVICLPMANDLTDSELERMCDFLAAHPV